MSLKGFPGGSAVMSLPANAGDPGYDPWVGKIPWRREWQPTLVFLLGEFHGYRSLGGYSPKGCKESNTTLLRRGHMEMPECFLV